MKSIGTAKWAPAKKLEYQTAKLEHRTRMLKLNQEIRERRKKVYVECGKCTWLDWLRSQAEAGREDAVQALRKRAHGLNKKFNAPSITGEAENAAPVLEQGQIDKVTKKGTVMYQVGQELVRHDAEGYSVAYASSLDTTVMALQMARKRFGKALTVTGGTDFKGKVIAAAVAGQLDITFTDARMETQRKQLLKERKEEQTRLEKQQSQKNER